MNILLVSIELPPSERSAGIGSYTWELAKSLVEAGHVVCVLTSSESFFRSTRKVIDGVYIHGISFPDYFTGRRLWRRVVNKFVNVIFYDLYRRRIAWSISKLDAEFSFDIVEFPEFGDEGKYWWCRKHIPTLIRFHGPSSLNRFRGRLEPITQRHRSEIRNVEYADGHSFISDALREVVACHIKRSPLTSVVVHNSVKVAPHFSEAAHSAGAQFSIVGAGSVGKDKGWDLLYDACCFLRAEGYDIRLDIFGRLADLGSLLSEKAITNKWFHLHGHTDRNTLFARYRSAHLCCFPSRFEPMGLTALEAMGSGGLVLAGSSGGWKEVIVDSKNGFLCDPRAGEVELAKKILQIMRLDSEVLADIRNQGRKYIVNTNSHGDFVERVLGVYRDVIAKSSV